MKEQPLPTPERIVEANGHVHSGWFAEPFREPNIEAAPLDHALAALAGTPLARLERGARALRMKHWHYTSVVTDKVLFACAVVDIGYIGNAFAYVVDRRTGEKYEYSTLTPGAAKVTMAKSSIDGTTAIRWPGFGRMELGYSSARAERTIEVALDGRRRPFARPPLSASYTIKDGGNAPEPVVVVEESAPNRWLYTHKCYGLEASGTVQCGHIADDVPMGGALAGLDWNKGYRPRETYWNWAAAAGHTRAGVVIGFNLTAHRRPGSAPAEGHTDATDCMLWLDGRRVKVGTVHFDYDTARMLEPWRIHDDEGRIDLRFTPAGERAENVNLGLVVSRFHQPFGVFDGSVSDERDTRHAVKNVYGVVEQHFARW